MKVLAAIYARKSTDQLGLSDEQKSVVRQVEHARGYAARKGWAVSDEYIFVDDAVSGAEFATRPGFVRLMATLRPRAPFQALVMAEESRLGREQIEVAYARLPDRQAAHERDGVRRRAGAREGATADLRCARAEGARRPRHWRHRVRLP